MPNLREEGAILLVSCYEQGHQPFHLASLNAMLRQEGYAPRVVDTSLDPLSDSTIRQARFIAISVPMHTALRLGEALARRVREVNPEAHICLYGLYALLNADHLLRDAIDSAIGGEYDVPLLKLVQALEEGVTFPPGVRTRQQASGAWIERTPFMVPLRRQLPALTRYARLQWGNDMRIVGYTESTRGCKHTCLHCPVTPVYQGRFFAIPQEIVLADIRAQVRRGARHITFGDPDFWNGPTHALRIARALHSEFPDVTFDATIKIEHLLKHAHLLPEMRELGCVFIVSAVESLNDNALLRLDKGHTAEEARRAFALTREAGIILRPSLLPFSPWESLESYIEILDFFEQEHYIEHIDPVHLSIRLLIPPGSALLEQEESQAWLRDLDAENYTYRWQHSDPRMDQLYERVATLVAEGERRQEDPALTFFQVKALALAAQGKDFSVEEALAAYGPREVLPHLTESWFC
ncbi:CUAEP/CCAEP-tail radical SAM (seleno)protein [Ktedonospora formicarum]|uniref:Radical SAM protein n=1 Tax=Ktedonospora formicarum TaxID=2778364 RepID=A0A8J3IAD1_9CHLR|nr:CUAEP/CCAEP-tail radical SAM protein [Ktedonospora formicarum]GHO48409.1 radical SAM protein [Ktedonospora formicarum]